MTGRGKCLTVRHFRGGAVRQAPARADARLLELVRQFRRHRTRLEVLFRVQEHLHYQSPEGIVADREISDLVSRCWNIRYEVTDLPARTAQGLAAKSWLALWELSEDGLEQKPESDDFGVGWSLANDILRRAA